MIELVLLRHAETEWNQQKKLQGRADIALSATGQMWLQQRALPEVFSGYTWFCSPLKRARQTAHMLGIEAETATALIEMDFGRWEGQVLKTLRQLQPEEMVREESRGLDMQPPGGESPRQVAARVINWLSQLPAGHYGTICHKGVMRALLAEALDWDMCDKPPIKVDWSALLVLRLHDGKLELVQANIPLELKYP